MYVCLFTLRGNPMLFCLYCLQDHYFHFRLGYNACDATAPAGCRMVTTGTCEPAYVDAQDSSRPCREPGSSASHNLWRELKSLNMAL